MNDADEQSGPIISESAQHLIDTMIDLVSEGGFEALSVRTVATRTGVSIGAVQHHFPTKSQMLIGAMSEIARRETKRFEQATADKNPTSRRSALLDILLPSNPDDPAARVWLQLSARASVDPAVKEINSARWGRLRSELADALRPQIAQPEDAMLRATELLALCDGLAVTILAEDGAVTSTTARTIVEGHIARLLPTAN
ncbi:TetR/AcrR family transcriptional regulator [Brevibacterium sp. FME17]|uniref:TetR/AcrR family transcriptional regulator n=1 Tax=Brevibacterium sp. FME17 TaxID=2742606 RepID=UPI0018673D41|nr:TetR/AcrR family transcriptional regulator [Brevibacterium sp. FME17]